MTKLVQSRYVPMPYQEKGDVGRVILRDGTTAQIRKTSPEDFELLRAFFERLSPQSRQRRFFSTSLPPANLLHSFCDNSNPKNALTLAVTRMERGQPLILAIGSYLAKDQKTVEVAFAVDDAVQGKGLGTILLERLAMVAIHNGFTRFWAITHADNRPMRDVFLHSGFEVTEQMDGMEIEVDLSIVPTERSVTLGEIRDRIATVASLRPFFKPNAVAVVGASRDPSSIGFRILDGLVRGRFQGPVYPVNPRADVVGCIHSFPSVRELPRQVDLAIISVPRQFVLDVVDDCAARGVRALIVITAGFAEVRDEGRDLQQQLVEKVRGYGMRMIGPNCLGLINTAPDVQLNASFSPLFPPSGPVAMSSQSGALGLAILGTASRLNIGLSSFVSVGNKADVSGNDLLLYWEEDEHTTVILLYLESFGNPRRFARIARRVGRKKPIIAMKAGRSVAGGRAAGSHTAALAASDVAVDALFAQSGVLRAETLREMFDLAAALSSTALPKGNRVGIITNAGGPAILCADACELGGLELPEFSEALKKLLASQLPPAASLSNPVDMIASASPQQYQHVAQTLLCSNEIDALIVIYISVGLAENEAVGQALATAVNQARKSQPPKPVLACLMAPDDEPLPIETEGGRIPTYAFPESTANVLSKMVHYAQWLAKPAGIIPEFDDLDITAAKQICTKALQSRNGGWLSAEETRGVLSSFRVPLVAGHLAKSAEEAVEVAKSIGFPVAVKLSTTTLVHKTEIGGVQLNLQTPEAVHRAFNEVRDRLIQANQLDAMEGVIVQNMISGGTEVMVGVTQDPLFGPLIAFGMGGVYVEVLGDVCFRITPLTDHDAAEMVRAIRGFKLLKGYRGKPAADIEALEELLLRISRLVEELEEVIELDLNPVFALPPGQGCRIVDARIRIGAA